MNRGDQIGAGLVLQDIGRGTGGEHPFAIVEVAVHRHRDDPRFGGSEANRLGRLDTAKTRHRHVQNDQVRLELVREPNRLRTVASLGNHLPARLLLQ